MSFSDVRNLEGKLDAKGFQVKTQLFGVVENFDCVEFNPKGKKIQRITITDDTRETQKVKIWLGNGPELTQANVRCAFELGPNPHQGNMYYSGFWNNTAQVEQGVQQSSNTQQGNPPPPQGRDYNRENHGKCFSLLLQALLMHGGDPTVSTTALTKIADLATACINSYDYRSTANPNPDYEENPAPPTDEIPF